MILKKYKLLLTIGITLCLFLFLNFGYFIATNWRNFLPKKVASLAFKPELTIYENEKYGFELKYPPDWSVKENENGIEVNPPAEENKYNRVYFAISPHKEFSSLDEVKEKLPPTLPLTPIELGQIIGFQYVDGGTHEVIWFKNKNMVYVVRKYATSGEADKISGSLKFKE